MSDVKGHMRSRAALVAEIVRNPIPDPSVIEELAAYGWDCENELVTVSVDDVLSVLQRFRKGELTAARVRAWANRIEGRDDIAYQFGGEGVVNEAVFWLANPYINWPIDLKLCKRIETLFKNGGNLDGNL